MTGTADCYDWAGIGSFLSGVGTIIGALAVIGAAYLGSRTFDSWRKQKLSERRIEQAERILTATYKARRGLSIVRNPMMFAHELAATEKHLKERDQWPNDEAEQRRLTSAQTIYNRLNAEMDNRRALDECQPMARALFGEELELAIEMLNRQFNTVSVYVDANYNDRDGSDRSFRNDISANLYEGWKVTGENKMDATIAEQVKIIERHCVPVLRLEAKQRQ
jgi:hypothetical protein